MDVAKDPLAKKETVLRHDNDASQEIDARHGIGHYALTITIGLLAGVIGGLLSSRVLKII